jgi:hypothetical protein
VAPPREQQPEDGSGGDRAHNRDRPTPAATKRRAPPISSASGPALRGRVEPIGSLSAPGTARSDRPASGRIETTLPSGSSTAKPVKRFKSRVLARSRLDSETTA